MRRTSVELPGLRGQRQWWLIGVSLTVALLVTGVSWGLIGGHFGSKAPAAKAQNSAPLAKAPTPVLHTGPPSGQLPAVPGPYLAESSAVNTAQTLAAQMGSGTTRVVSATLETVTQGSKAVGQTPSEWVGDFISPNRMVWLVWLQGPYRIFSCPQGPCQAWSSRLYYDVVDATSGALLLTGTSTPPS